VSDLTFDAGSTAPHAASEPAAPPGCVFAEAAACVQILASLRVLSEEVGHFRNELVELRTEMRTMAGEVVQIREQLAESRGAAAAEEQITVRRLQWLGWLWGLVRGAVVRLAAVLF